MLPERGERTDGVELKALSGATDAAGGYAVPEELDQQIERTLAAISPIRAIASTIEQVAAASDDSTN